MTRERPTSALFYVPERGFVSKSWAPAAWLCGSVPWLAWGIVLVVGFGALWLLLVGRPLWRLDRKALSNV